MQNDYAKVEKISREGYTFEFGTVLEDAFNNYKKIFGLGGVAMLILCVAWCAVFFGLLGLIYGFGNFTGTMLALNPQFMSGNKMIVMLLVSSVVGGLTNNITAGFIKMAYLADQGKEFGIGTPFDYFKSIHFRELFLSGLLVGFFGNGVNYLLTFLGVLYWGTLATYIIMFLTFLTVPLIIFSNLTAVQAINMSVKLVLKQPLMLLGLLLVSLVLMCLGVIGCGIGLFFTIPFIYSMYFTIYAAIFPLEKKHDLDEIGRHEE